MQATSPQPDLRGMTERSENAALDRLLRSSLSSFPFDLQARLGAAHSVQDVYEIGVAMLARVPGTIGVRIFQRDDRGQLVVVHSWQSPLSNSEKTSNEELAQIVHARWIATHGVGRGPNEFARPFADSLVPAWLIAPMFSGDELIGAIAAERRDGRSFAYAPEDIVAFSAAAAGMAWGIQSIFLRDRTDILSQQEAREDLIQQERREIGRELHDSVVQDLAYVSLKIELAGKYLPNEPEVARGELKAGRDLLDHAIVELRRTIGELRRPAPARRGITGQLRALVSTLAPDEPELEVDFRQISGVQLVPEVERAVVGIVREALQNVRKHARAQSVRLEVRRAEDELRLYVVDDGVGMDEHDPRPVGHFGMELMRELAEDLGGTLRVDSDAGKGTQIEAYLPLVLPALSTGGDSSGLAASELQRATPFAPNMDDFIAEQK
ncbi:MAG TPA: sensor histidine kinase [Thermomicrobiales bacterium]|nr:sensor histidine kinase [Thermomicrobiales bacterium]